MKWRRPSLATCLFIVAMAVRVLFLGVVPASIETEETVLGYAASSWAAFGARGAFVVDPLTEQSLASPLYVFLSLPSVAAMGPSALSIRLVSALAGVVSLWSFARLARRESLAWRDVALLVIATSPWHLMASRWASGAHLAPALVLAAVLVFEGARAAGVRLVGATLLLSASLFASGPAAVFAVAFFAWAAHAARRAGARPSALAASLVVSPPAVLSVLAVTAHTPGGVLSPRAILGAIEFLPAVPGGIARVPLNAGKVVSLLLGAATDGTTFGAVGFGPHLLLLVPFLALGIQVALNAAAATDRAMLVWFVIAVGVACLYRADLRNMSLVFVPALWLSARGLWSIVAHPESPPIASFLLRGFTAFLGAWFSVAYFAETGGKGYAGTWMGFGPAMQRALLAAPAGAPIIVTAHHANAYMPTLFHAGVPPERFTATARVGSVPIPGPAPAPGVVPSRRDVTTFDRFLFGSGPQEVGRAGGRAPYWIAERSEWAPFDAPIFAVESFGRYAVVSIRAPEQHCYTPIDTAHFQGKQDFGVLGVDGSVGASGAGFSVAGQRFTTGFGVHGESAYTVAVSGERELTFGIGMSDAPACGDGVIFEVLVDDRPVFTSSQYRPGDLEFRRIAVSPRRTLTFATHPGSNTACDHANWLRPALTGCG